jgi:hypothetical protein
MTRDNKDLGRVPDGTGLSSPTEPASGLGPSGFDPSRIEQAIRHMTKTQPRALAALPREGVWQTASELKHKTTAVSLDVLYIMGRVGPYRLCDRRWTRWGGEPGQKRGEGYEYTITPFGEAVRTALRDSDGSPKGGDAAGGSVRSTTARAEGIAQGDPS